MCGRLNLYNSPLVLRLLTTLGIDLFPERPPRYNIAPTANLDVVVGAHDVRQMQWSIEFGKFRHPNTKVETLQRKPHLEKLLLTQRCLVPVNRFYEWPDPKVRPQWTGIKTRFCIHTAIEVMFLAGIYKKNEAGTEQFNILTTDPNSQITEFHHRMPVIIPPAQVSTWLGAEQINDLYALTLPYQDEMIIYECDSSVDSGRNQGPQCMAPLGHRPVQASLL